MKSETIEEMIEKWDSGESIWSVEMGGLGPGYEQALQILFVETLRNLVDKDPTGDDEENWEIVEEARGEAHKNLDVDYGFSYAQAGAAANLALHFWIKGPEKVRDEDEVQDRLIQVSNNMKHTPKSSNDPETYIDIVFDSPPSPEGKGKGACFIDVENPNGQSIQLGEWIEREDGCWALRLTRLPERVTNAN